MIPVALPLVLLVALQATASRPRVPAQAGADPGWTEACGSIPTTRFGSASRIEARPDVRELLERVDREQRCMLRMANAAPTDRPATWTKIGTILTAQKFDNALWLRTALKRRPLLSVRYSNSLGSTAAWLIVQHADHDPPWQRSVLRKIRRLASAHDFPPEDLALLTDRVAVNFGKPQIYGSQGRCLPDGAWHPKRIVHPGDVDRRRGQVGLQPLQEYVAGFTC